jgi:hypothetical protein
MKKIVLIVSLLLAFTGFSFAQTTPATGAKKSKTAATATTAKPATTAAGPTKKDGTPDMRYKTNKDAAKAPPAHLKADGTPDKRFKENKAPATAAAPKKKAGA